MAEEAAAAPAAPAKKAPKKPKVPAAHPPYGAMIVAAIKELKERTGSSRQAVLKYILAKYKVGDEKKAAVRVKIALKKAVSAGTLKQVKGAGASGSFKIAKEEKSAAAKKAAPKKKAATPKKKAAAKKSAPKEKAD